MHLLTAHPLSTPAAVLSHLEDLRRLAVVECRAAVNADRHRAAERWCDVNVELLRLRMRLRAAWRGTVMEDECRGYTTPPPAPAPAPPPPSAC